MRLVTCATVAACVVLASALPSAQKPTRDAAAAIHERIAATVGDIRLVDTHEHLSAEAVRLKGEMSLFSLLHYVSSDMWADGLDRAASEPVLGRSTLSLEKQWEMIAPYWAHVRTTAYGRALLRAVRDLYGEHGAAPTMLDGGLHVPRPSVEVLNFLHQDQSKLGSGFRS